jgi:hypothetical protein
VITARSTDERALHVEADRVLLLRHQVGEKKAEFSQLSSETGVSFSSPRTSKPTQQSNQQKALLPQ